MRASLEFRTVKLKSVVFLNNLLGVARCLLLYPRHSELYRCILFHCIDALISLQLGIDLSERTDHQKKY